QDEARAEAERRYAKSAYIPLTPDATRNALREAFEEGAAWQASRKPETAPSTATRYEPCVVGADGECTRWSHDHTAASQPEATSDTTAHARDRMGICRNCGMGITAVEVLDGEKRCVSSQPVQVE